MSERAHLFEEYGGLLTLEKSIAKRAGQPAKGDAVNPIETGA